LYWIFRSIDQFVPLGIPGLGLVITVTFVTLVGFFSSSVIGRTVLDFTERILRGVPLVKLLYNSIKDLVGTFVGSKKGTNRPVKVRISTDLDCFVLGFVTREAVAELGSTDHVAVYFPQSYNFAGNLVLVPRKLIEPLDLPSSELMTFIVSGGVSGLGVGESMLPPALRD
jgi:uncharacterized membrane protein